MKLKVQAKKPTQLFCNKFCKSQIILSSECDSWMFSHKYVTTTGISLFIILYEYEVCWLCIAKHFDDSWWQDFQPTLVYQIQVPACLNYFLLFPPPPSTGLIQYSMLIIRQGIFSSAWLNHIQHEHFFQRHIKQTTSIHEEIY